MNRKKALEICKEYGYDVSFMKIYRYGKSKGFLIPCDNGKIKFELDENKLRQWLESCKIPSDMISVSKISKQTKIPYNVFKYKLKDKFVKMGIEDEYYVKRSYAESVINEYHKRSEK